jgi:hypothetical protein
MGTEFKRPDKGLRGFLELSVLHQELTQTEMAEFVIGIIRRHLSELGNSLLQLAHDWLAVPETILRKEPGLT